MAANRCLLGLLIFFSAGLNAWAFILGPYTPDAATLHLWHLDESALPARDAVAGGTNFTALDGPARLGAPSFSGFALALNTKGTNGNGGASSAGLSLLPLLAGSTADDAFLAYADALSGAFSIEALIRPDFDPASYTNSASMFIVTAENDGSTNRPWQFRLRPPGETSATLYPSAWRLAFANNNGSTPNGGIIEALVPTNGPNALLSNAWFHVAATFDGPGAGGHLLLYWTRLEPAAVAANLIFSGTMGGLNPLASATCDFAIGQVGRGASAQNFVGLLDEVRLSSRARSPVEMLFNSTNVVLVTQPQDQTVADGGVLSLNVVAAGAQPLAYQWRCNGLALADATQSSYTVTAAALSNSGSYEVLVSNRLSGAISIPAWVSVVGTNRLALRIQPAQTNVLLFWPLSLLDWAPQGLSELDASARWLPLTNLPGISGNENVATVALSGPRQFFRLCAASHVAVSDAVVPIDWSRFSAGLPTDANAQRVGAILKNASKYALTAWWTNKYGSQSATNYLDFGGGGETQIRPPAVQALGLAVALQTGLYDPALSGISTAEARARTLKLVRSIAARHLVNQSGGWGNDWQSALWAAAAGNAGWLLWSNLAAVDQEYVRRMVENEANRFNAFAVPYYRDRAGRLVTAGDTKSEENAWNASVLHLALCMMPAHPNRSPWRTKAIELSLSTYARPSDVSRTNLYHGKALAAWLNGSNCNEDGTLLNHNRVHPDYMAAGLSEFQPASVYLLAGKTVPVASLFNLEQVYHAVTEINFVAGQKPYADGLTNQAPGGFIYMRDALGQPSGELYFPQGNDWGSPHPLNVANLDCVVGAFGLDGLSGIPAAQWEAQHDDFILSMQARFSDGHTFLNSTEFSYSGREEWITDFSGRSFLTKWLLHQAPAQFNNN